MYLLDYNRNLHQEGKDGTEFTIERFDDTAAYRYTAFINIDNLLILREIITDDVTVTTFAMFNNGADEIDEYWEAREFLDYARFDVIQPDALLFNASHDFPNANGTGGVNVSCSDPSVAGKENIQITGGKLTGVAVPIVATSTNDNVDLILDEEVSDAVVLAYTEGEYSVGDFASTTIKINGTGDTLFLTVILTHNPFNLMYSITINDGGGTLVATVYNSMTTIPAGTLKISIDMANEEVSVYYSSLVLTNNIGVDISDGGSLPADTPISSVNVRLSGGINQESSSAIKTSAFKVFKKAVTT